MNIRSQPYRAASRKVFNRSVLLAALTVATVSVTIPVKQVQAQAVDARQHIAILTGLQGTYQSSEGSRMSLHLNTSGERPRIIGSAGLAANGAVEGLHLSLGSIAQNIFGTWNIGDLATKNVSGPAMFGNGIIQLTSNDLGFTHYVLCPIGQVDQDLTYVGGDGWWGKFLDARTEISPAGSRSVLVRMRIKNVGIRRQPHISTLGGQLTRSSGTLKATSFHDAEATRDGVDGPTISTCGQAVVTWRFADVNDAVTAFSPLVRGRATRAIPISVAAHPDTSTPGPSMPQPPAPGPAPSVPAPVPNTPPATPQPGPAPAPLPRPTTPGPVSGPVPQAPTGDFQPLAKWDVRLDRVENPRDDRLTHVYLTLRNAGTGTLLQTQDVWVYLEDASGVEQRSGQGLQPLPGYPKLFGSPPPVVRPGKEIRTKFVFDRHQSANPTRITVEEGGKEAVYEF